MAAALASIREIERAWEIPRPVRAASERPDAPDPET